MSRARKAALLEFGPYGFLFVAVIVIVAFMYWYGSQWWEKLTGPFKYWGGVASSVGWQVQHGYISDAFGTLWGYLKSSFNAARGDKAPAQVEPIQIGAPVSGDVVANLPLPKAPDIFSWGV